MTAVSKVYSVYGLYAEGQSFYCGHTSLSPAMRLQQHIYAARIGKIDGPVREYIRGLSARGIRPTIIVWEEHSNKKDALARERVLTFYIRDLCGAFLANDSIGVHHSAQTLARIKTVLGTPQARKRNRDRGRAAGLQSNNVSGHKGVYWQAGRGKWKAEIKVAGRPIFLGRFDAIGDAIEARLQGEKTYWHTAETSSDENTD